MTSQKYFVRVFSDTMNNPEFLGWFGDTGVNAGSGWAYLVGEDDEDHPPGTASVVEVVSSFEPDGTQRLVSGTRIMNGAEEWGEYMYWKDGLKYAEGYKLLLGPGWQRGAHVTIKRQSDPNGAYVHIHHNRTTGYLTYYSLAPSDTKARFQFVPVGDA